TNPDGVRARLNAEFVLDLGVLDVIILAATAPSDDRWKHQVVLSRRVHAFRVGVLIEVPVLVLHRRLINYGGAKDPGPASRQVVKRIGRYPRKPLIVLFDAAAMVLVLVVLPSQSHKDRVLAARLEIDFADVLGVVIWTIYLLLRDRAEAGEQVQL